MCFRHITCYVKDIGNTANSPNKVTRQAAYTCCTMGTTLSTHTSVQWMYLFIYIHMYKPTWLCTKWYHGELHKAAIIPINILRFLSVCWYPAGIPNCICRRAALPKQRLLLQSFCVKSINWCWQYTHTKVKVRIPSSEILAEILPKKAFLLHWITFICDTIIDQLRTNYFVLPAYGGR